MHTDSSQHFLRAYEAAYANIDNFREISVAHNFYKTFLILFVGIQQTFLSSSSLQRINLACEHIHWTQNTADQS